MANTTKTLKSIKGRRLRITRLSPTGDPVAGACSSVVTDGFISVAVSQEVQDGDEITQPNAWGDNCINDKSADLVKWVNVTMSFCLVNPDILDIVAGGNPLATGTAPNQTFIGASFGPATNTDRFAIEVWTKKVNDAIVSPTEWGYLVVPNIQNGRIDGDITIENGALTLGMVGQGVEATSDWGVGPYLDNPLLVTAGMPVGDQFALVTTTVQPPAVTAGCAAVT
jgi:hypothetical protein